jgi:hypothetical protein
MAKDINLRFETFLLDNHIKLFVEMTATDVEVVGQENVSSLRVRKFGVIGRLHENGMIQGAAAIRRTARGSWSSLDELIEIWAADFSGKTIVFLNDSVVVPNLLGE